MIDDDPKKPSLRVGLIEIRNHCTFTWQEPEGGGRRSVEVRAAHCVKCVAELRELGYRLVHGDRKTNEMK